MKTVLLITGLFLFLSHAPCACMQRLATKAIGTSAWRINQQQLAAYQNLRARNIAIIQSQQFKLDKDKKKSMLTLAAGITFTAAGLVLAERMINEKEKPKEKEDGK